MVVVCGREWRGRMTHRIRRVAVLGAGTMGAAIAAHCANSGLEVDLLDMTPEELTEEEEREVRNRIVREGFERMRNSRPPALMTEGVTERMRLGNFEDDFDRVSEADWVLEAIVERLEPKRELMRRDEGIAQGGRIVSS